MSFKTENIQLTYVNIWIFSYNQNNVRNIRLDMNLNIEVQINKNPDIQSSPIAFKQNNFLNIEVVFRL